MTPTMRKVVALAAIPIVALTVFAASCASRPSTQEIMLKTISATQGVTSLKTAVGLVATTETTGGSKPGTTDITISGAGVVDVPGKNSALSLEMTFTPPGEAARTVNTDVFVVGGWEYVYSVQDATWTKFSLPAGTKGPESQMEQQTMLLRTASTAVYSGQEDVDGVKCYVLKLTPDLNALWQWFLYQGKAAGLQQPPPASVNLAKATKDAQLTIWVDSDKFLVKKVQGSMAVEFTPADVGASASDFASMGVVLSGELSMSDYNVPVDIRLPADAQKATDVTGKIQGQ